MNTKKHIVCAWDSFNYGPLNGWHPIFKYMLETDSQEYSFFRSQEIYFPHLYFGYDDLFHTFGTTLRVKPGKQHSEAFEATWNYFCFDEQTISEFSDADILFQHTFPLSLNQKSFIFHYEQVRNFFLPLLNSPVNAQVHHQFEDYRNYIASIFNSDSCLAIFTHYTDGIKEFKKLFPDVNKEIGLVDIGARKLLNRNYTSAEHKKNLLLFATSFHGNSGNEDLRGIDKFVELCATLPKDLGLEPVVIMNPGSKNYKKCVNAKIRVLRSPIDNMAMQRLLERSKYLYNGSPAIHTGAMLDCLEHKIIPIVNLFPAYKELGFSSGKNCIDLSEKPLLQSPLGFQVNKVKQKTTKRLIHEISSIRYSDNRDAFKLTLPTNQSFQLSEIITECLKGSKLKTFQVEVCTRPIYFELDNIEIFEKKPIYTPIAEFDGLIILSNNITYIFTVDNNVMRDKAQKHFMNTPDVFEFAGRRIFNDLEYFWSAYNWAASKFAKDANLPPPVEISPAVESYLHLFLKHHVAKIKFILGPLYNPLKKLYNLL